MTPDDEIAEVAARLELHDLLGLARDVARTCGVPLDDMLSRQRTKKIAAARALLLCAVYARGHSSTEVGAMFRRHHVTVLHALRRTKRSRKGCAA